MAIRRLNYTGRKRLRRNDTRITLYEANNGAARFVADLNLDNYGLPGDALVFVEAYRQTSWMRFSFGTVGQLDVQDDLLLSEFDSPEGILFRVRVTSNVEPSGLLLAEAERIRPRRADEEEENRISLLPVRPSEDLGKEVFRVDFEDEPILLVNAKVTDWREVAIDPVFGSLVYSAALREILTRIVLIDEYTDTEDNESWQSQWLSFATFLPGVPDLDESGDRYVLEDWINEAVASFCRQFNLMDRFIRYWIEESRQ
jgi:hypothetical protein